jgi:hypothetical protein
MSTGTDIIACLANQEEATAFLYETFSQLLPEMRAFWAELVVAEKAHAQVLRQFGEFSRDGSVYLNEKLFNTAAIQTNIEFIIMQGKISLVEGITPIRALALASDVEHSLVEMGYFRIIETDQPAIKQELDEIDRHTRYHIALVDEKLRELKARGDSREG